jgi:phage repressor protein C with HTH and peptisase S24 domain
MEGGISTERFAQASEPAAISVEKPSLPTPFEPFRRLPIEEVLPFVNSVPLYELSAAAGRFSDAQELDEVAQADEIRRPEEFRWIELPQEFRSRRGLFVARVVGESMNRRIPNGSWCLFRLAPQGTRQGKVVLVQLRDSTDPETGGHYTVKLYESEKRMTPDGQWRHSVIVLRPDSTSPAFEPITLDPNEADRLRVIAELVAVLG